MLSRTYALNDLTVKIAPCALEVPALTVEIELRMPMRAGARLNQFGFTAAAAGADARLPWDPGFRLSQVFMTPE
jgi:hypothetical protein